MLVFIGGPPGVGKSTVLRHVERSLDRCACLDADDVWRVHPFAIDESLGPIFEHNVVTVLRGYLQARYPVVILGWVLANPDLFGRLLDSVAGRYDALLQLYLTASPEALRHRADGQPDRAATPEYVRLKAAQIEALPHPKIDTTDLTPAEVASRIVSAIRDAAGAPTGRTPP